MSADVGVREAQIERVARAIAEGCNLDPDAYSEKAASAGHKIPEWMFFGPAAAKAIAALNAPAESVKAPEGVTIPAGMIARECPYNHPGGTRCPACAGWPYAKGGAAAFMASRPNTITADDAVAKERERLMTALEPFAREAENYDYGDTVGEPDCTGSPDASSINEVNDLTVGDLRAARAAIRSLSPDTEGKG